MYVVEDAWGNPIRYQAAWSVSDLGGSAVRICRCSDGATLATLGITVPRGARKRAPSRALRLRWIRDSVERHQIDGGNDGPET